MRSENDKKSREFSRNENLAGLCMKLTQPLLLQGRDHVTVESYCSALKMFILHSFDFSHLSNIDCDKVSHLREVCAQFAKLRGKYVL